MKTTSRWFRFYAESYRDPKIIRLSDKIYRFWANCLCLASENSGLLPNEKDIACHLRIKETEAAARVAELLSVGLLDDTDNGLSPHNWHNRQYTSDVSTDRVKRFRNGQRNVSSAFQKQDEAVAETPPDTETDTDTEERVEVAAKPAAPRTPSGSRLSEEKLPDEWRIWAFKNCSVSAPQAAAIFEQFRDYWIATAGAKGRKADWFATWRNWCRRDNAVKATQPMFSVPREQLGEAHQLYVDPWAHLKGSDGKA